MDDQTLLKLREATVPVGAPITEVTQAVAELFRRDHLLLEVDVSERAITHRLALYLTPLFSEYDVDCEYNRHGTDPRKSKKLYSLLSNNPDPGNNGNGSLVLPDIVVHRRGIDSDNLLVIEVKKAVGSETDDTRDLDKLRAYCDSREREGLNYRYGLFLKFGAGVSSPVLKSVVWLPKKEC